MKYLYLIFFSISVYSQSKTIDLKIISLTDIDSTEERAFTVNYSITNNSDKTINFILNPNGIIPIGSGSMKPFIYYKVYQDNSSINVSNIFAEKKDIRHFKNDEEANKFIDSIRKVYKEMTPEKIIQDNKNTVLKNIQEMKAGETREYSKTIRWDKTRYFKNDVMEYYLDEKEKHFYELHINLMKEELLSNFSEDEKNEILKDKNFIKGWFTSNKVEINFRE